MDFFKEVTEEVFTAFLRRLDGIASATSDNIIEYRLTSLSPETRAVVAIKTPYSFLILDDLGWETLGEPLTLEGFDQYRKTLN